MSLYEVQAMFQGTTGLPKDRFENTFFFTGAVGSTLEDEVTCACRVADFYKTVGLASGGLAVASYLSGVLIPTLHLKVYDHADPKPRPIRYQADTPCSVNSHGLPEQVAICVSYFGARNIPTQRGRIYVGPLDTAALGTIASGGVRPSANVVDALTQAAIRLAHSGDYVIPNDVWADGFFPTSGGITAPANASTVSWVVFSRKGATKTTLITDGWVDNEWDGQHRRRIGATARSAWVN